jgi:hypothetical protein
MQEKIAELINVVFGFRKFILMVLLFGVGVIFRLKGYVDGGQFVDLMKNTTIAFFAANGFEHLTTTVREYIAANGKKIEEIVTDGGEDK